MPQQPIQRRTIALVLVVLATLAAFVAIFSVWVNRQLLNTENWTATSSELLERPVIRDRVAAYLVDEIYLNVDVAGEIRAALPPRAAPLAGPAAGALRSFAERAARQALARPRAQAAWEDANREAHRMLVRVLEGGGPVVSTQGGVVTLNLKQLLVETQARVGLGGRLSRALPASAGTVTILRSDELDSMQSAFKILKALPIVLVCLSLLLFAAALLVSPGWRRQAIRAYGIGFIVAGALCLAAISLLGDEVVSSVAREEAGEPAVREAWEIATTLLREIAVSTIGYGVLMLVGAVLAGPTVVATAIRRALAPYLREPALAYGVLALLLAAGILWWAPTPATRNPVTALVLVVLIAAGFEGLRRRTAREFPDANRHDAEQRMREHLAGAVASVRRRMDRDGTGDTAVTTVGNGASEDALRLNQLEQLGRLRDAGTVDSEEFSREKARILGGVAH
jgi:hypothetical protein